MKRLLSPLLFLSLFLLSTGCGDVFVRGAIETGSTIQGSGSKAIFLRIFTGNAADSQVSWHGR